MKLQHLILIGIAIQALACNEPIAPPVASAIVPVSALALEGFIAEPLSDSLRVQVTDQRGAPMAGVAVSWSVSDGTVSPAQAKTDADGLATAWHLGESATQQVTATVVELPPVTFTAQADHRWYELITSFKWYTYYVGCCPGGSGYCSESVPAGDARLTGRLHLRMIHGDTVRLVRRPHPLDSSMEGLRLFYASSSYGPTLNFVSNGKNVYLQHAQRSGDNLVGEVYWETKPGPTGRSYRGTFVLRRLQSIPCSCDVHGREEVRVT